MMIPTCLNKRAEGDHNQAHPLVLAGWAESANLHLQEGELPLTPDPPADTFKSANEFPSLLV